MNEVFETVSKQWSSTCAKFDLVIQGI